MTALTKDRNTAQRQGDEFNHPVAAAKKIHAGSIVVLDAARNAAPGSVATGLLAVGRAQEAVDNSAGSAGDKTVQIRQGTFSFANDGTIARADIGKTAYIVDDQTVADNDGSAARSAAGAIVDVDTDGVWVKIG